MCDAQWLCELWQTDEDIILRENGVQKARSLHRVALEERFLRVKQEGGNLKATIVTQQDQGPSGHGRVYLTTKVVAKHGATLAVAVSVWDHTQTLVECDWKRHWPMGEQILSKRLCQRLHHPVLLRRCQHNLAERADGYRWSWDQKNAENAKDCGQARRREVKSIDRADSGRFGTVILSVQNHKISRMGEMNSKNFEKKMRIFSILLNRKTINFAPRSSVIIPEWEMERLERESLNVRIKHGDNEERNIAQI